MKNIETSTNTLSYRNLEELLKKTKAEKGSFHTNTRIGDKNLGIYGGIYNIDYTDNFWDKYNPTVNFT